MRRLHDSPSGRRQRRARSGMLTAWSAFALLAVGLCAAVAVHRSLNSLAWVQTRQCADAAALAGCRELLCDDLLREAADRPDPAWCVLRCRTRAVELAERHAGRRLAAGRAVPVLQPQQVDVLQRVWSDEASRYLTVADSASPDTVRVRLSNRQSGSVRSAGLMGAGRTVVSCEATAWMHDRICGFRTGRGISIPMAPLAIPEDPQQPTPGTWWATDSDEGADDYAWDRDSRQVRPEPDGLLELSLILQRTDAQLMPGQLIPVPLCDHQHATPLADHLQRGLQHEQTVAAGLGLLSFPRSATTGELSESDFEALTEVLTGMIGEKRIFPLADLSEVPPADSADVWLSSVVAARILDVQLIDDDQLELRLQPTVMSPACAVICRDTSVPANRYIRKIALLR